MILDQFDSNRGPCPDHSPPLRDSPHGVSLDGESVPQSGKSVEQDYASLIWNMLQQKQDRAIRLSLFLSKKKAATVTTDEIKFFDPDEKRNFEFCVPPSIPIHLSGRF